MKPEGYRPLNNVMVVLSHVTLLQLAIQVFDVWLIGRGQVFIEGDLGCGRHLARLGWKSTMRLPHYPIGRRANDLLETTKQFTLYLKRFQVKWLLASIEA
jgi:hypothetical protein